MKKFFLGITYTVTVMLSLTGCVSNETPTNDPKNGATNLVKEQNMQDAIIIDVRTPAEYATGHLEGAQLFDISDPDFKNQISKLDKTKKYVVYCRSGNRSASATTAMQNTGFTNVTNIGGVNDAAKTLSVEIVK